MVKIKKLFNRRRAVVEDVSVNDLVNRYEGHLIDCGLMTSASGSRVNNKRSLFILGMFVVGLFRYGFNSSVSQWFLSHYSLDDETKRLIFLIGGDLFRCLGTTAGPALNLVIAFGCAFCIGSQILVMRAKKDGSMIDVRELLPADHESTQSQSPQSTSPRPSLQSIHVDVAKDDMVKTMGRVVKLLRALHVFVRISHDDDGFGDFCCNNHSRRLICH